MDLSTKYCGLTLSHPIVPGASPLADDLGTVRRLEDAGAAAIALRSLFEEQVTREQDRTEHDLTAHLDGFAEASGFLPRPVEFKLGPVEYLEQIRRIKAAVKVPVIASLNGTTSSGWLDYAKWIEQAGADALELNMYYLATDPTEDGAMVEKRMIALVSAVKRSVKIPIAVKLSPFFSSMAHHAARLEEAGADALVLFNRFYQPDIDVEALEAKPELHLSDSSELLLRLRWLAILSAQRNVDFAVSGGVHEPVDAVKAIMTGASVVQVVSTLLKHGPGRITHLRDGLADWLESHEYDSVAQLRGSMNHARSPDPGAFERGNYMRILQSWKS
ncbi:MAG: dihydroorotate dehydrogenase-like protein [Deltaproteobacteria bacterium]